MIDLMTAKIAIIGLGYVGLPLAVEFSKYRPVLGFDIDAVRVESLKAGKDSTEEVTAGELAAAPRLQFTTDIQALADCNVYIITVPTPIDVHNNPNLKPLIAASENVSKVISKGDVVIYESTVYPGATEEDCVPVIEQHSGLTFNVDFFAGYSPERINPGDKTRRLPNIIKITSGSTPEAAHFVDSLYREIITAGTHLAPSIKVAEAAKVIENTQRDVNVALINELALVFHRLGIDTGDVLEAAGTKWNFLNFKPGLVGGHCIGVDPYYLTHKAQAAGYHPEIILAARKVNSAMGKMVVAELIKEMIRKGVSVVGAKILVMGLTFKEDCPDLRNTRVIDVISELEGYGVDVHVCDPRADKAQAKAEYGIELLKAPQKGCYDAIVLAVSHKEFVAMGHDALVALGKQNAVIYDLKHMLPAGMADLRL